MLVSAAWCGPAVLGAVNVVAQRRLGGDRSASAGELLFAGGDWLLYAFLTPIVFVLSERWPIARPHVARNVSRHVAMSGLFCAAWAAAGTLLRLLVAPSTLYFPPGRYFVSWLFITLPFGVAVYLCVVGIEHAVRSFATARDRELQVARLAEQLSSARFAALQAQLNPHFVFNTLNTIAVFVRDGDRSGAVRIVEQLGEVLRRTLTRDRANEVTLAEELELIRQYIAIESARFSDRLRADVEVDDGLSSAAVPAFAVQHLVENAIRHGVAKDPDAGVVRLRARRVADVLEITVEDDGAGFDETTAHMPGHGIDNTRERLRALYGDRASLTVARAAIRGTIATLRLPYHRLATEHRDGGR